MRFWEEMQGIYGFSDGESVPDGATTYRAIYIRSVNRLAEQLDSSVRVVAYDRVGVHNPCLVLFYRLSDLSTQRIQDFTLYSDFVAEIVSADTAMEAAIEQAKLMDVDRFVVVSISIAEQFDLFLSQLRAVKDDEPLIVTVNNQPQHFYLGGKVKLVHPSPTLDGRVLAGNREWEILWLDHQARLVGLAVEEAPSPAFVRADELLVTHIPSDVRAGSDNSDPIPPFHFRTLDDDVLDGWEMFFNYEMGLDMLQQLANERDETIQLVNGYSNTVIAADPEE